MSGKTFNVCIVGAGGGIGQPLSLLMKQSDLVADLTLLDIVDVNGIAVDLSHICTAAVCHGFSSENTDKALQGRDLVIIPAGVPRKPGMNRDDLFNVNAGIVSGIAKNCAKYCPQAAFLIISNPVNSMVPIFAEVLKAEGVFDAKKLFGVTALDSVRAKTFIGELKKVSPLSVSLPIVGGHSGPTIVPLLSQSGYEFTQEETEALTKRIQHGGDEVVQAKGNGSATLSMAYAGADFAFSVLRGMAGQKSKACGYIAKQDGADFPTDFFATEIELGLSGVEAINNSHTKTLSDFEQKLLATAITSLQTNITKAYDWVKAQ